MKELKLTKGMVTLVDDDDFFWLNQWNWVAAITTTGCYASRCGRKKSDDGRNLGIKCRFLMHRVIMGLMYSTDPNVIVDHKDGNGLNNQRSNLRICSKLQNNVNRRAIKGCRSAYKGVYWDLRHKAWTSEIRKGNYKKYLGLFSSEIEAAKAYDIQAFLWHGEYAQQNFPGIHKTTYIPKRLDRRADRRKPVINTETGEIYDTVTAAWRSSGISIKTFFDKLTGKIDNDISYQYYEPNLILQ